MRDLNAPGQLREYDIFQANATWSMTYLSNQRETKRVTPSGSRGSAQVTQNLRLTFRYAADCGQQ